MTSPAEFEAVLLHSPPEIRNTVSVGVRFAVTLFTPSRLEKLSPADWHNLKMLGFPVHLYLEREQGGVCEGLRPSCVPLGEVVATLQGQADQATCVPSDYSEKASRPHMDLKPRTTGPSGSKSSSCNRTSGGVPNTSSPSSVASASTSANTSASGIYLERSLTYHAHPIPKGRKF